MKFLTIRQPWASLIAVGAKTIETRPFSTKYRGPLAIHAGKAKPTVSSLPGWTDVTGEPIAEGPGLTWLDMEAWRVVPMPLGAVVAVCDLVDVVPITDDMIDPAHHFVTIAFERAYLRRRHKRGITDSVVTGQLPFGDFTPGRFAWLLSNVRAIEPVPMKGAQGLRDVPAVVAEQINVARSFTLTDMEETRDA